MMPQTVKNSIAESTPPFELKGSLFTLTVMHLRQMDNAAIDRFLAEKARQAPAFFKNVPVVIDLEALAGVDAPMDFVGLYNLLRNRGMIPVGIRHGNADQQTAAVMAGLPILSEGRSPASGRKNGRPSEASAVARNKLITQQVRSGQQIYAPDGDLIVMGAISPGAEVLADGNVHIYATLRGRALAGVKGNVKARIFCQSLEAELVSIAGCYRVMEQVEADLRGKPVHVFLSDNRLIIEPLTR